MTPKQAAQKTCIGNFFVVVISVPFVFPFSACRILFLPHFPSRISSAPFSAPPLPITGTTLAVIMCDDSQRSVTLFCQISSNRERRNQSVYYRINSVGRDQPISRAWHNCAGCKTTTSPAADVHARVIPACRHYECNLLPSGLGRARAHTHRERGGEYGGLIGRCRSGAWADPAGGVSHAGMSVSTPMRTSPANRWNSCRPSYHLNDRVWLMDITCQSLSTCWKNKTGKSSNNIDGKCEKSCKQKL